MGHIKNIVDYFFHHDLSQKMTERVHSRLITEEDRGERDRAIRDIWDELDKETLSTKDSKRAYARLEKRIKRFDQRPFLSKRYIQIAALWIIPLISISASFYFISQAQQIEHNIEEFSFVEHYVKSGKRERITLPDSSKVWLNSNTLLVYPSTFYGNKREVYLSGEGYFDVCSNKKQPFIVRTNTILINVLGTKFNLSAYPDAEKTSATLEAGSINVVIKGDEQSYTLTPNEHLSFIPGTGAVNLSKVNVENYTSWKVGGLLFKGDSFNTVIRTLERVYDINMHIRTSAYSKNNLTIHFKQNETLENVLMLIKETIPELSYRINGEEVYIE